MCCQLKMQGSEQQRLNISHTPRFFSWAQIHSCPSSPHSPEGCKAPGTVLSHYQLHPAAPSSTHFSPVPEWDPSQEPQSSRINLLPEGLQFLQEIPTCASAGPVKTSVDPYSGLVPSKGCRTVPAPSQSYPGQQGNLSSGACSAFCPFPLTLLLTGCSQLHYAAFCHLKPRHAASPLPGPETPIYLHHERPSQLPGRHRPYFYFGAVQEEK